MGKLVASDRVTADQFKGLDAKMMRTLTNTRLGLMMIRRKTMTIKGGRYQLQHVNPPLTDEQKAWVNSEPVTVDKLVFAWNVCASYLAYCSKLAKGVAK